MPKQTTANYYDAPSKCQVRLDDMEAGNFRYLAALSAANQTTVRAAMRRATKDL